MKARRVLRESNETLKEGYGFANQREDCKKFETEQGIEVVKEHQVVETSSSWNREKFEKIIDEAIEQREEIPAIVFPRVNRFARNIEAAGYFLGRLRQNGLFVMFALEKLVVNNDASAITVLMFFIHSYQADEDGKIIKHSMLGGRDRLAVEAHQIPNGMVIWPFDYMPKRIYGKIVTGKPSINKERAAWVRKWAERVLEDGYGLADVCRETNKADIKTRRGGKFWPKAIRDIMRSSQLIGEFWWKGKLYLKDESLRILTDEVFEAVQKRLDDNRERRYYNAAKYDYPPLPKMVFHSCGQLMYGVPINEKPYYRCPKCKKSSINAQKLWHDIQRDMKGDLLREERLIPAIRAQFDDIEVIARLEQDIKAKDAEIQKQENAKDVAFRMGMLITNYPVERVQAEIDKTEARIQCLKTERMELEKRWNALKERRLNVEGIRRFCQLVATNIDNLTKNQWENLNQLLKLKIIVYSRNLVKVNLALPPVRESEIEFSRL